MPLYEYLCQACGQKIEVIQKFSDPPLETCEKCGGQLQKLLSSPAIQFKGAGWYITDYSRKGDSGGATSSKPDSGSSAKASESKGDSESKGESAKADSTKSTPDSTSAGTDSAKKDSTNKTASG